MSEARFTPGPWRVFNVADVFPDDADKEGLRQIADCAVGVEIGFHEAAANAHLIAAAPELLAALRLAKDHSELEDEVLDIVNDAIAKASPSTPDMEEVSHG